MKIEQQPSGVLMISIEDDGIGMLEPEWGISREPQYGLVGMKERALMIGSRLSITSDIGEGTTVTLEIR